MAKILEIRGALCPYPPWLRPMIAKFGFTFDDSKTFWIFVKSIEKVLQTVHCEFCNTFFIFIAN